MVTVVSAGVGIAEDVIALTGVAEGLAMRLRRLALRLPLLESGRRDRHDLKFLVFVPKGKKQPPDAFYPPLVQRHTNPRRSQFPGPYIEGS